MVAKPTKVLRASIPRLTGKTRHLLHGEPIGGPVSVEIHQTDGGFFLLHIDSAGDSIADTWHQSLDDAKAQAKFEYEIVDSDWSST